MEKDLLHEIQDVIGNGLREISKVMDSLERLEIYQDIILNIQHKCLDEYKRRENYHVKKS